MRNVTRNTDEQKKRKLEFFSETSEIDAANIASTLLLVISSYEGHNQNVKRACPHEAMKNRGSSLRRLFARRRGPRAFIRFISDTLKDNDNK